MLTRLHYLGLLELLKQSAFKSVEQNEAIFSRITSNFDKKNAHLN